MNEEFFNDIVEQSGASETCYESDITNIIKAAVQRCVDELYDMGGDVFAEELFARAGL